MWLFEGGAARIPSRTPRPVAEPPIHRASRSATQTSLLSRLSELYSQCEHCRRHAKFQDFGRVWSRKQARRRRQGQMRVGTPEAAVDSETKFRHRSDSGKGRSVWHSMNYYVTFERCRINHVPRSHTSGLCPLFVRQTPRFAERGATALEHSSDLGPNRIDMEVVALCVNAVICCISAALAPRILEWLRACWVLRSMPGPMGGIMGQLKYFNDSVVGQHKSVLRWAREFGGIYRVRLANVNVSPPWTCCSTQNPISCTLF